LYYYIIKNFIFLINKNGGIVMAEINKKENIMGIMPIPKLVISIGVPLMLSILINSLYNFVDSVFVSHVSEDALTAVSLSNPIQILISALGCGNAVGLNAVISKALGEKDYTKVKKTASASIVIAICAWILIIVSCILFIKPYFKWQANGNTIIEQQGIMYLNICMIFSLGQMGQWVFDRFVIASGKSKLFLITLTSASITNLILDPIFIFGFGFIPAMIPAMGTAGAAIATVTGQFVGCICGYYINKKFNTEIPFNFTFNPDKNSILQILKIGIPTTLVQGVVSFVGIFMNSVLMGFSTTAVAVYGVCGKIQSLVTAGVHGINNGLIPIIAYNYGANNKNRIVESIKWALIYAFSIYAVFFVFLEFCPDLVLKLFAASPDMMAVGTIALRILAVSYFVSIVGVVLASVFQALSLASYSMYLTMARQVMLPLIFVLLFRNTGNLTLIWVSFIIAEIISIPIGYILWYKATKQVNIKYKSMEA